MEKANISFTKTGTTIVGWKGRDFVIIAADQQTSAGYKIMNKDTKKVRLIANRFALANAGTVGDIQRLVRVLDSQVSLYEIERSRKMSVNAFVNFLSNVLNYNRYYPFGVAFIMAGFDNEAKLYSTDAIGGLSEHKEYSAMGSGSDFAEGYLEQAYDISKDKKKALEEVKKAILSSKAKDVFSGGRKINYIIIDKNGVEEGTI